MSKKIALDKVRKQLKKDDKTRNVELGLAHANEKRVPNDDKKLANQIQKKRTKAELAKEIREEEARREFFTEINTNFSKIDKNISLSWLKDQESKFFEDKSAPESRKWFYEKLLKIPHELHIRYINQYLAQQDLNSLDFLMSFMADKRIEDLYHNYIFQDQQEADTQIELIKRKNDENLVVTEKEENYRRRQLGRILENIKTSENTVEDEDIINNLASNLMLFKNTDKVDRIKFIEQLLASIPPTRYVEFLTNYLAQTELNSQQFLNKFMKESDKDMEKILDRFGTPERREKVETTIEGGRRDRLLLTNNSMDYRKKCEDTIIHPPWLGFNSVGLFLSPLENDNSISEYISEKGDISSAEWYHPNEKFWKLLNETKRTNTGDITSLTTSEGNVYKFRMAYKDRNTNKYVVFDNEIAKKEYEYKSEEKISETKIVNDILNSQIDRNTIETIEGILSVNFFAIASDTDLYQRKNDETSNYIKILVETMKNKAENSNLSLITDTARLLTAIQFSISDKGSQIFVDRIKNEYYLPQILAKLNNFELFPEIYQEYDGKRGEDTKSIINDQIEKQKIVIAKLIYKNKNPNTSKFKRINITSFMPKDVVNGFVPCMGDKSIENYRVIYYVDTDDNKNYCFDIEKLHSQFRSGNFTNINSGKQFNQTFIDHVLSYQIKQKVDKSSYDTEDEKNAEEREEMTELFPDLFKFVEEELRYRENNQNSEKSPTPDAASDDSSDELSEEEILEISDTKSKDDEDDSGSESDEEKKQTNDEDDDLDSELSEEEIQEIESETEFDGESPPPVKTVSFKEDNVCANCKNKTSCNFKTKIKRGNNFQTVCFCCVKCFEDFSIKK